MRVAVDGERYGSIREAAEKVFGRILGQRQSGYAGAKYRLRRWIGEGGYLMVKWEPQRVTLARMRKWCALTGHRLECERRGVWRAA